LGNSYPALEPDGTNPLGQHHGQVAGLLTAHAPEGLAVTNVLIGRGVDSMKKGTQGPRRGTVSTVKKSQDSNADA